MQRATFCSSAPFNHEPRLKLHSCPNKDSCNGAHFSAKKLNAPIVILLLCKIAPRRRIICKHSADPWPLGRQRESRGEESLVWEAMHLLVDEGAHYPQCAQRAIHERASGASLFLQAPAAPAQR
jgi:hypothetical protein